MYFYVLGLNANDARHLRPQLMFDVNRSLEHIQ